MDLPQPLLIIFIKNPEKGKVKTRLAREVGDERALEIYKQLLDHTHSITTDLKVEKVLYYSTKIDIGDQWELGDYKKRIQEGNDLGDKMSNAFQAGFDNGNQPICIIGSDCFEINEPILAEAFEKLKEYDFVIGPAKDGGYYLLGMREPAPQLFANKTYSTPKVCAEAIHEIQQMSKTCFLLPTLSDIDTLKDLNP
ncbi:TIGR04282 family arsenosugar biosynthesis glycosyltransferase [Reichenbachiella sp. MALMAid0571]|uniref:TIGR04282 family arsenosugar biosynthesis glycosyltransferase n=1 Tax=Reichenbachiella sp. MALMAid0571 TaxID=3143939 RepID=UPI0032DFA12F